MFSELAIRVVAGAGVQSCRMTVISEFQRGGHIPLPGKSRDFLSVYLAKQILFLKKPRRTWFMDSGTSPAAEEAGAGVDRGPRLSLSRLSLGGGSFPLPTPAPCLLV